MELKDAFSVAKDDSNVVTIQDGTFLFLCLGRGVEGSQRAQKPLLIIRQNLWEEEIKRDREGESKTSHTVTNSLKPSR